MPLNGEKGRFSVRWAIIRPMVGNLKTCGLAQSLLKRRKTEQGV